MKEVYVIIVSTSPEGFMKCHKGPWLMSEEAVDYIKLPESNNGWEYSINTYRNRGEFLNSDFF